MMDYLYLDMNSKKDVSLNCPGMNITMFPLGSKTYDVGKKSTGPTCRYAESDDLLLPPRTFRLN